MIRIRSLSEGFRRAGVAHSVAPTEYPDDRFTAAELEQLLFEPKLAVEVLANDAGGDTGKSDDADKSDDAGKSDDESKSDDADMSAKKPAK